MFLSAREAREAESHLQKQVVNRARQYLRADESEAQNSADKMKMRRLMQAALNLSPAFHEMFAEADTNRLFACGALYLVKPET